MSENRSLAVLEVLVHVSASLPDRYLLGMADLPPGLPIEEVNDDRLPDNWATLDPSEQIATRRIGDQWVEARRTAILSVPSVVSGERNYVLNPAHAARSGFRSRPSAGTNWLRTDRERSGMSAASPRICYSGSHPIKEAQ